MNDIQHDEVRTGAHPFGEWLSVVEAVAYCQSQGLSRTAKTVRKWAQQAHKVEDGAGDIVVRSQDVGNGFRWQINRDSLDVKIQQELEFDQRPEEVRTGAHPSGEVATGAHTSAPVRTGAAEDTIEEENNEKDLKIKNLEEENEKLRGENMNLTIDNKAKEQVTTQLAKEREQFYKDSKRQMYQIGSLETQLRAIGAPVDDQHDEVPEIVPPDAEDGGGEGSYPHQ
jgi:hypothetical protein